MYSLEIDNKKVCNTTNLKQIFKYLYKNFTKEVIDKVYQEYYGGILIEFYYVPNGDSLSCISIIEKLPKTNIIKLLKEKRKIIKIDDNFSLIPKRKKNVKCPHIDPAFYGKEGYIRKGYDNFLWMNKKVKNKWIWEDYISPL